MSFTVIRSVEFRAVEFRADLKEQAGWYVEQGGFELAERYTSAVTEPLSRLARHPFSGRPRRFRSPALQGLCSVMAIRPFDAHVVFYRIEGEIVLLVRVMHGTRDLPHRLRQSPVGD